MKTKEELNALKEEVKTLSRKLRELTEEELAQVSGGDATSANVVGNTEQSDVYSSEYRQQCPSCHGTSVNYKLDLNTFLYNCHCNGCKKDYIAR